MFCSQCGTEYRTETHTCQRCGTRAAQPAGPASTVAGSHVECAIWNPNATANWSLLFTPAFGAYLQMLNWRALGEPEKSAESKNWFHASVGMLLVALLLAASMNDSHAASNVVRMLGSSFLLAWYFSSGRQQAKYVKEKLGPEYVRRSWAKPLLIGVGGLVAYFIAAAVAEFLLGFAK